MTRRLHSPAVALLLILGAGLGPVRAQPPTLEPLAMPDLSAIDETARQELEQQRRAVDELSSADPSSRAGAWGTLGQQFHAYEFHDAARIAYSNAAHLEPRDFRWPYYEGLVRESLGDLEGASSIWQRALSLRPGDVPLRIRLADVLLELGDAAGARALLEAVVTEDPENAAAHWGLGRAALEQGDSDEAISRLERTLELQPEATRVHYTLGQAWRRAGDLDKARYHLSRRGEGDPLYPDPLGLQIDRLRKGTAFQIVLDMAAREDLSAEEMLGFTLGQFGEIRGTIDELRRGLAARKGDAETTPGELARIHFVLGGLLVGSGKDEEALEAFRDALREDRFLHDARIKLGNIYARTGRMEKALTEYSLVLQNAPDKTGVRLKVAAAKMELGRFEDALADLDRVVEAEPALVEARLRRATCLLRLERWADAEGGFRGALEMQPRPREEAGARTYLASLVAARGDAAGALEQLETAVAVDPKFPAARTALGARYAEVGRWDDAAEQYAAVVEARPEDVPARLAGATALIYAGRHAEARDVLEAGLEAVPGDGRIEDVLARHLAVSPDRDVRDGPRAVELARRVRERWDTVQSAETLAMAYAEARDFEQAIRWQQTAIEEAGDADPPTTARLRAHLDLYRRSIPCCEE